MATSLEGHGNFASETISYTKLFIIDSINALKFEIDIQAELYLSNQSLNESEKSRINKTRMQTIQIIEKYEKECISNIHNLNLISFSSYEGTYLLNIFHNNVQSLDL